MGALVGADSIQFNVGGYYTATNKIIIDLEGASSADSFYVICLSSSVEKYRFKFGGPVYAQGNNPIYLWLNIPCERFTLIRAKTATIPGRVHFIWTD